MTKAGLKSIWDSSMLRAVSGGTMEIGKLDDCETRVRIYLDFVIITESQDEFVDELNKLINKYKI